MAIKPKVLPCMAANKAFEKQKRRWPWTMDQRNVKVQKNRDESWNYFEVPLGKYRLSAFGVTAENALKLLFLPPHADVLVKSPLFNVEFSQALVNVLGIVVCKEKCGAYISVTLMRLGGIHNERRKIVSLIDESSQFLFPNEKVLHIVGSTIDLRSYSTWIFWGMCPFGRKGKNHSINMGCYMHVWISTAWTPVNNLCCSIARETYCGCLFEFRNPSCNSFVNCPCNTRNFYVRVKL